jgi:YjbE family integral membrane protein
VDTFSFGATTFGWPFFSALLSIVVIDLVLAGDNAVVIAMAVRSLPKDLRRRGILYGSAAAVLLRVVVTFFVARLLTLEYVKLAGGLVILWIAVKLFVEDEEAEVTHREAGNVWHAVRLIVIADITMALDNMLAVGGASQGNFFLLLFGLALSIPFVVFASSILSALMDRYPFVIFIGGAILGKVGGEMIMTDPVMARFVPSGPALRYAVEFLCAAGVILAGQAQVRRDLARQNRAGNSQAREGSD